jgi:starch-binding outer membrane protein, SusD/RagB family
MKYLPFMIGLLLATGCSDKFLDINPRGEFQEGTYYRNATEAFNGLVAVYDIVGYQSNGYVTKLGAMDAGSDDHLAGGGGANDVTPFQVFTKYTITPDQGPQSDLWSKGYKGISRANVLLSKLPDVNMDEALKKRYIAETKFLRAFFYFDLVRLFKNIPLITTVINTSNMGDVVQAKPEEVYALIEQDLKDAIAEESLPDMVNIATDGGRVTKGAAHALLGKVYLYEQKYAESATELAEVNGPIPGQKNVKYGYQLLPSFNSLWAADSSNKFNNESIFEAAFTSTSAGDWGCISCSEGNVLNIMVGPRDYSPKVIAAPDFVSGWSFLVVTPSLHEAMQGDPRYDATILDMNKLEANNIASYSKGYDNTGYFLAKFAGRVSNTPTGAGARELNYPQNLYEIRLADTYLMEAEALVKSGATNTRAYDLLNAVRARVNLPAIPATDENIFNERRLELAGEGHRWFDLVRTGRAPAVLGSRGFVAGKNEILPIPLLELNNTKLEQSKEWGGTK